MHRIRHNWIILNRLRKYVRRSRNCHDANNAIPAPISHWFNDTGTAPAEGTCFTLHCVGLSVCMSISLIGLVTHSDCSRGVRFFTGVCLSVCFTHAISRTDAAIWPPKLTQNISAWVLVYFGVKGQGHEAQKPCRRGSLHSCECWLLSVCCLAGRCVNTEMSL